LRAGTPELISSEQPRDAEEFTAISQFPRVLRQEETKKTERSAGRDSQAQSDRQSEITENSGPAAENSAEPLRVGASATAVPHAMDVKKRMPGLGK